MARKDVVRLRRIPGAAKTPRLRFDKVVTRVMTRLQAAIERTAPQGVTVLLTITAPIRLASKTAAAIEENIETLLSGGARRRQGSTIHGNDVLIEVLHEDVRRKARVIGFVHHRDSDPRVILDVARQLVEVSMGPRVVAMSDGTSAALATYQTIYDAMRLERRITLAFSDGHCMILGRDDGRTS